MAMPTAARLSPEHRGTLLLVAVCVLLITVGVMARIPAAAPVTLSVALNSIASAEMVEIRDSRNVAVLSGEFRSRVDSLGNTELDAALRDRKGHTVVGEVELEIPARGRTDRRPELEVDILSLPPRQTFTVVIDDRIVGTFVTDDRGSVDLELQEGEVAPFPTQ